jgi:hypothetical protein
MRTSIQISGTWKLTVSNEEKTFEDYCHVLINATGVLKYGKLAASRLQLLLN